MINLGYDAQDPVAAGAAGVRAAGGVSGYREIPYDYAATFTLAGVIGNRVQDVINVSVDGAFVAVGIGYSFKPFQPAEVPPATTTILRRSNLLQKRKGAAVTLANFLGLLDTSNPTLALDLVESCLLRHCGIDFLYTIVDSASGRELQNQPLHNIAGLGSADGQRPFRPFAKPMVFAPRSTIRIEIIEQCSGDVYANGQLFIVLQGYKMLGAGTP
jgi:hypothetical protein